MNYFNILAQCLSGGRHELFMLTCVMYFPCGFRITIEELRMSLMKSHISPCGVDDRGMSVKSPNT